MGKNKDNSKLPHGSDYHGNGEHYSSKNNFFTHQGKRYEQVEFSEMMVGISIIGIGVILIIGWVVSIVC